MANFNGLTFAVVPVVTGAGALNTAGLPSGTVIAGIVDPVSTQRIFNPQAEGNPVASGDAYNHWLPSLGAAVSAAEVDDQYWSDVPGNSVPSPNNKVGQVTLKLTPAAANTVEAPSVMTFKVSPQALVITCTAGTF